MRASGREIWPAAESRRVRSASETPASSSRLLAMDSSNSAAACIRSVKADGFDLFLSFVIVALAIRSLVSAEHRRQCVSGDAINAEDDFRRAFWRFARKIARFMDTKELTAADYLFKLWPWIE